MPREPIVTGIYAKVTDGTQIYNYLITDMPYRDRAIESGLVGGCAQQRILPNANFDITEEISFQPQGGNSGVSISTIPIDNTDGGLDDWARYIFAGQSWVVKRGYASQSWDEFETLFVGEGKGRPEFSGQTIYVTLRSPFGYMKEPIAQAVFDSDTANQSLINTIAPMVFGEVFQVKPKLADPNILAYFSADNLAQTYSVAEGGNTETPLWVELPQGAQLLASPSLVITSDIAGPPAEVTDEIEDALDGQGQFDQWGSTGELDYPDLAVQTTDDATLTEGANSDTGVFEILAATPSDTGWVVGSVVVQKPHARYDAGDDWANATVAALTSQDGNSATVTTQLRTKKIGMRNIGSPIPSGATITGIELVAYVTTTSPAVDAVRFAALGFQLGNGTIFEKSNFANFGSSNDGEFTQGGNGDLFGANTDILTPEAIADENFYFYASFADRQANFSSAISLDRLNIKIYYTEQERYVRMTWSDVMDVGERYTVAIESVGSESPKDSLLADWTNSVDSQDPQSSRTALVEGTGAVGYVFTAGQSDFDLYFRRGGNGNQEIASITLRKGSSSQNRYHDLVRYIHTLAGKDPDVVCDNDSLALVEAQADNPRLGHYVQDQTTREQLSTYLSHSLAAVSWGGIDGLWKAAQLRVPGQPTGEFLEVFDVISEPDNIPDYAEDLRDRTHGARNFYPIPESEAAGVTTNWTRNQREQIMAEWRITEKADFDNLVDYDGDSGETLSISSIEPATGADAGGTLVTVYGSGYKAGAAVTFGGNAATSITVVDSNTITCETPAGTAGSVDVVVTVDGDSATLVNGFEYETAAAGHAYWRLYINSSAAGNYAAMAELEFAESSGGADLCSGGSAVYSSQYSPSFLAANAFDDNDATSWATAPGAGAADSYIGYSFAAAVDVGAFRITARPESGGEAQTPTSFKLQYSDDGSAWTDVESYTSTGWAVSETREFLVT